MQWVFESSEGADRDFIDLNRMIRGWKYHFQYKLRVYELVYWWVEQSLQLQVIIIDIKCQRCLFEFVTKYVYDLGIYFEASQFWREKENKTLLMYDNMTYRNAGITN